MTKLEQIQTIVRLEMHISSTKQGCKLLEEAEVLLLENPEQKRKELLQLLAKQHNSFSKSIEGQMQRAISHAYSRCGWTEYFPEHTHEPSVWEVLQKIQALLKARNWT